MTSEDRWTRPAEGEDPRTIDREMTDAGAVARRRADRPVTHDQERERAQGTSADAPGVDASDREREGGRPTAEP